ncbi:autotransporter [Burkholderia sp. SCN-KJ]|uniref:autotransporter n=1 Tax=Burkholderia sp. SCN-KJ TaxID=2969248 RepID=UPI00214F88E2|nr:autotransporter [Burkholderia sp. SCN-KJ]MCR4468342.1 autotransporter [Burkholderia sp. SCN-KJ]
MSAVNATSSSRPAHTDLAESTATPATHTAATHPATTRTPAGNASVPTQQTAARTDETALGRMKNQLSRTGARLRAGKIDVSTAVFQGSTHGKPFAPADFTAGGKRYPVKAVAGSTAAGNALAKTEKQNRQALSKTARMNARAEVGSLRAEAPPPLEGRATGNRASNGDDVPLATLDEARALHNAMDGHDGLLSYVARAMPAAPANRQAAVQLSNSLAALGAPEGAPPTTRGALVAQALRGANVADAADAGQVLAAIRGLDFAKAATARSTTMADAKAWWVARALSRTHGGFEALEHLRGGSDPTPADASKRLAQRIMLQTADALDPVPPTYTTTADGTPHHDPSPGAVAAAAAPPPDTPTEAAPLAWRAYHASAALLSYGRNALTADQKGAFFAWRQNFREDGRGSDLSRAQERLNKFSAKTIDRVGDNRMTNFVPRVFGQQKSPLSALSFGTQGLPRKAVDKERAKLADALKAALPALVERPEMSPGAAVSHARPLQSIVELAALQVWLESGGFPNDRADATHVRAIADRARQMCMGLGAERSEQSEQSERSDRPATPDALRAQTDSWADADPQALARSQPFKSIVAQSFNADRLEAWGKVANVPRDAPFWASVAAIRAAARPSDTPPSRNIASVRETLKQISGELQSSARLRLSDGGRVGGSTRGASANIGKLLQLTSVPVAPRVDLRASKSREAVVELSRGTHGAEMFIGTAQTQARRAGVGVLVGYDVDVSLTQLRAGVVTQATLHAQELTKASGVSLRVARRVKADGSGYDDKSMHRKLETIVDHVFDEATAARTGRARDTWNRLAERYFDDPDVSVSWTDTVGDTVKRGGSVDAGVSALVPKVGSPLRAGANIGIGYERTARQTLDSTEHSGRLQIEQHRVGGGSRLLGRVSGAFGVTMPVGNAPSTVGLGFLSLEAPAATMTFADDSSVSKVQLVREDGALMHRACLLDTEYSSAQAYTSALDAGREEWVSLFAREIADKQQAERQQAAKNGLPAPPQADPRILAGERIDAHLGDIKANRRPNQTYFHRYRLRRSAAARLDVLSALNQGLPRDAAVERAALDEKTARILSDAASWMPLELKVKERTASTQRPGLNFALQLATQTSAIGDRELFAQSVPFSLAERLDTSGIG